MQTAVEQRIKDLHTRLHITSAEESQWTQFAQLMRDNAKATDALYQAREQKVGTMTAVENLQSYSEIAQKHAEDIQKLVPAFQTLYDTFSTQQKKQADDVFRNYAEQAAQSRAAKK
jgi:isopropylmalate/homocitrate/citramalate synthase